MSEFVNFVRLNKTYSIVQWNMKLCINICLKTIVFYNLIEEIWKNLQTNEKIVRGAKWGLFITFDLREKMAAIQLTIKKLNNWFIWPSNTCTLIQYMIFNNFLQQLIFNALNINIFVSI